MMAVAARMIADYMYVEVCREEGVSMNGMLYFHHAQRHALVGREV
jgi:hypothetical protein